MRSIALAALAVAVMVVSMRWGSFVAGGSDSYCYVHQAEGWATGRLQVPEPLALDAPWPNAGWTFAPAGHVPSSTVRGAHVPVCAAGLSIAMAPFVMVGGPFAAFYVIPFFGAALVLATYAVGARFGTRIGMAAACLIACSPPFLFQLIQPMSDVPAAALWTLAVAWATGTKSRHAILAGLAASAAILMRPNLLPLGFVIGAFLLLRPERTAHERVRSALTYAACCAPGCLGVALIQQMFYGSPLESGYGALGRLFGPEHVVPNITRYFSWLWQTHTPAIALAALAPIVLPGPMTSLLGGLFLVNVTLYVPYVVFEDWSFLRFLLPTIPLVLILMVAVIDALWRRIGWSGAKPMLAIATVVLAVLFVRAARDRHTFRLQFLEARFARAGEFVRRRLPENALVITSWQSGSVRFYSGRKTLVWDQLDPAWLDRAVAVVRGRGYEPYLLFERWEEPLFRRRFTSSPLAQLDWPPMAEIGGQVRIYTPEGREQYAHGLLAPTEYAQ